MRPKTADALNVIVHLLEAHSVGLDREIRNSPDDLSQEIDNRGDIEKLDRQRLLFKINYLESSGRGRINCASRTPNF